MKLANMCLSSRALGLVVLGVLCCIGATALAQGGYEGSVAPDGFVPAAPGQNTDNVPGGWLMVSAYMGMWTILLVWVFSLVRRLRETSQALADVSRRLQDVDDRLDDLERAPADR